MKKKDLTAMRQANKKELEKKIRDVQMQLRKAQQIDGQQQKNTRTTRVLRKQLAQLMTIAKELSLEKASAYTL